ncbi:MAG: hypothetical protein RL367_270 [Pseudomonadota bacterium]
MSAPLRLMLETNVEVSAFLWKGKPGRLLALAGEGDIRMFRNQFMLDKLQATLNKPKLAKVVAATELTSTTMIVDYR